MKTPIEHLRSLSKKHRDHVAKAQEIARRMKAQAEAAQKAISSEETPTE